METTLDKIKTMVRTANSGSDILSPEMVKEVMPKVIEAINNQASEIGYDGFTYDRPQHEYPEMMYTLLWMNPIRATVLDYLEEKCPMAWFKPMYFTTDKQKEIGIIPDAKHIDKNSREFEQSRGRMNRDDSKIEIIDITTGEIMQIKKHKNRPVAKIKYHKGYFTVNGEVRKITNKKKI